jgi:hypothetical protein
MQAHNNTGFSILYIQPQNNIGSSIYAATKQHRIVHIAHAATKNIGLSILGMQPQNNNFHVLLTYINININIRFITGQQSQEHFNLPLLLSCNGNNFINFVTSESTVLILPEDDADALKHTAVLVTYKILFIYTSIVHLLVWSVLFTHYFADDKLEKNEMGSACSSDLVERRHVQGLGGETRGNETTG